MLIRGRLSDNGRNRSIGKSGCANDRPVIIVDCMVTTTMEARRRSVDLPRTLIKIYVSVVVATIVALAIMSSVGSGLATSAAWIHAAIVGVFAVLLPLRLRSAARGSNDALRAVGIIAAALFAVNAVEAAIPGLLPTWMRIEMIGIAVLMAAVVMSVVRARR